MRSAPSRSSAVLLSRQVGRNRRSTRSRPSVERQTRARARRRCRRPDRAPSERRAVGTWPRRAARRPRCPSTMPSTQPPEGARDEERAGRRRARTAAASGTGLCRVPTPGCADCRLSSARLAACPPGCPAPAAITCCHASSRPSRSCLPNALARCRRSAASWRAWDRSSATCRTARAPCRAGSCSSSRRRGRC